jgi:acetoin utilization deacetylase AcuC-like enzyme
MSPRVPANFTRRRDLFLDAGFADPDGALAALAAEVAALALPTAWHAQPPEQGLAELSAALAPRVAAVLEGGYNVDTLPRLVRAAHEGFGA